VVVHQHQPQTVAKVSGGFSHAASDFEIMFRFAIFGSVRLKY
jgi:hypothetical protein